MTKQRYSPSIGHAIAVALAEGFSRSSLEGARSTLRPTGPGRPPGYVFPGRRQLNRWEHERGDFARMLETAEAVRALPPDIREQRLARAFEAWRREVAP